MRSKCKYKVQRGTGQIIKAEESIINSWDDLGQSCVVLSVHIVLISNPLNREGKVCYEVSRTIIST